MDTSGGQRQTSDAQLGQANKAATAAREQVEQLLQAAAAVQGARTEAEALQAVADAVHRAGWGSAAAHSFRGWEKAHSAFAGMTEQQIKFLSGGRVTPAKREAMYSCEREPYRVSRSYFIPEKDVPQLVDGRPILPSHRPQQPSDTWRSKDLAYVPMRASDGTIIGTIALDNPDDGQRPNEDQFRRLEFFADLAAQSIQRRRAEEEMHTSERFLQSIIQNEPECVKLIAADGTLLDINPAGMAMLGVDSKDALVGRCIYDVLGNDDRDRYKQFNERVCNGSRETLEFQVVDLNGKRHHMETTAVPLVHGMSGETVQLGITRDVTERKRSEEERQAQLETQKLLLNEIDHRLRNDLSSLLTLIEMSRAGHQTIDEFAAAVHARTRAIVSVHSVLAEAQWRGADLEKMVMTIAEPTGAMDVCLDGPPMMIPRTQAKAFGLIINELCTNSRKYGAMSVAGASVSIAWSIDESDDDQTHVTLQWREIGGPVIEASPTAGTGTSIIVGLARSELRGDAELSYPREGALHEIHMVLAGSGEAHFHPEPTMQTT